MTRVRTTSKGKLRRVARVAPPNPPKDKIKVLLLENVATTAVDAFKAEGLDVEFLKTSLPEAELKRKIADAHILGIRSKTQVTPAVLAEGKLLYER